MGRELARAMILENAEGVRKDDAAFGQKIRQWIESYIASEVSILMDEEFQNARD